MSCKSRPNGKVDLAQDPLDPNVWEWDPRITNDIMNNQWGFMQEEQRIFSSVDCQRILSACFWLEWSIKSPSRELSIASWMRKQLQQRIKKYVWWASDLPDSSNQFPRADKCSHSTLSYRKNPTVSITDWFFWCELLTKLKKRENNTVPVRVISENNVAKANSAQGRHGRVSNVVHVAVSVLAVLSIRI